MKRHFHERQRSQRGCGDLEATPEIHPQEASARQASSSLNQWLFVSFVSFCKSRFPSFRWKAGLTLLRLGMLLLGLFPFSNQAADLSLPIVQGSDLAVLDPGNGEGPHFVYRLVLHESGTPPEEYYRVGFTLVTTSYGRPLRASATRIDFPAGELVGPANRNYRDSGGGNWIYVQHFDEARDFPGADWRYMDVAAQEPDPFRRSLRTKTEFFLGFRFTGDRGQHYGWMRFTRPDTNFLTFFELTAWDSNPLPGEPIGAGLSPVIPLTPVLTTVGLRLAWPAPVWNWVLETSETLGPDTVWEPVPDAGGPEVHLPLPETNRFFRLRMP